MLRIFMGSELIDNEIEDKRFIRFPNSYFNRVKKADWFEDAFVKEVIKDIDKAYVELGYAVRSIEYGTGYSVDSLAGGSKFLILAHKIRDKVFLCTMGDNCVPFLERISHEYEKDGKDLLIVSNYLHRFEFKEVKQIEYINWGIICTSYIDIQDKVYPKWYEQEHRDKIEITKEEEEEEIEYLSNIIGKMINTEVNSDDISKSV